MKRIIAAYSQLFCPDDAGGCKAQANPTGLSVRVVGFGSGQWQSAQCDGVAKCFSQLAFVQHRAGEATTFFQPSAQSIVWNQINDANPSQITVT